MVHMAEKNCITCKTAFLGGPRAFYCPACRIERKKQISREHKERKRLGLSRRVGDLMVCVDCGIKYEYYIGAKDRCPDCAKKHLKEIDNVKSLEWKHSNKDKYLQAKRDFDKLRRTGESSKTGEKYICFDKASRKYRVVVKGKHIGYYKTIDDAIIARDDFIKKQNED